VAADLLDFCLGETPHAVATLAGYAGVGKTTVVAHVVAGLPLEAMRVVVAAPTHKALSVLGEKLGGQSVELATLHSLLGLKLSNKDDGSQVVVDENKGSSLHEYALAIVDEASMVSAGLFEAVLSKRLRCRVLFVGDPAQLAPVDGEKGALSPAFGELVPQHWTMTEVVRQAQDNPIIRLATAVRGCIERGQDFSVHALASELRGGDDRFLAVQPGGVAEVSRLVADAIGHGQDTRALAWDNATVEAINANVHAMVYPGQGPYPAGALLMANESLTAVDCLVRTKKVPVRNSALLTVVSSELEQHQDEPQRKAWRLVVSAEDGQRLECWVPDDVRQLQADISQCFAEFRRLKLREQMATGGERAAYREQARAASGEGWALRARYAPLRYAYAMTVHKSQGSTFDAVVLDWNSFQRCREVATRNRLIYVALTRTRRFAVVCA
jgi:exodeoxyribonuclease V